MPGGSKRNRRELAVAAMVSEPTIEGAATKAGVSTRTLKGWLKEPDFAQSVREARAMVLKGTINLTLAVSGKAVATLHRNLDCGNGAVEVRAAVAILDHARSGVEAADVLEQLAELQETVGRLTRQNERRGRWQPTPPPAVNASVEAKPNIETNGHAETNGHTNGHLDPPEGPPPLFEGDP